MKKIFSCLLIAAMMLQLVACSGGTAKETEAATEAATETTETTRVQHQIPDELDFGGETFSVAFFADAGAEKNYYAEETSSDNMVAAVFRRTKKVEDFLGITIKYETDVEQSDYKTLYKSGDDLYQQLFYPEALSFVTEGYLQNLEELPYLDFTADWWNAEQMDRLTLGKYPYFAVCDFMITSPTVLLFNRNMITDNNLENPYDLVLNNTWTLDKFSEMLFAVINDIDGDGAFGGEDDIVGSNIESFGAVALLTGCDQMISAKNEAGKLELVLNSEKTLSIIDKFITIFQTGGAIVNAETLNPVNNGKKSFGSGKVLFSVGWPETMATVTNYDFNTGIVPMPKFNEEQKNYMCYDMSGLMAVSGTTKNKDLVGAALEFLAWDSKNEVFPTYYDVLLKTSNASDMETRQMMDIIFDSIAYEIGGVYFNMQPGFCELWYTGAQALVWGLSNFSAFFRAYKNPARSTIENFYTELAKFEGPMDFETQAAQ